MESWINILMIIIELSALAYLLIIMLITFGWFKTDEFNTKSEPKSSKISIVVAIRNEAANIIKLLNSIANQSLGTEYFELIVVDDGSTDNGVKQIEDFVNSHKQLNIKLITSSGIGKKQALMQGIKQAQNEIIFTTDGDCVLNKELLEIYLSYFETHQDVKLAFGSVIYSQQKGMLNSIFNLEFSTLVASGAGSAGIGLPLMANGANMAFKLSAHNYVVDGLSGKKFASGDDVFLIHGMGKEFGNKSLKFIKNRDALVETPAPESVTAFFKQRIRWGSKSIAYKSFWPILVALSVFVFNFLMVVLAILSFYKAWFLAVFVLLVLLKFLIDLPLSRNFAKYFQLKKGCFLLFPLEFIYPFYIVISALFPLFFNYSWKSRSRLK